MNLLGIKDKDINFTKEILSGIVIAIALVPEAIAFSFVLGINPMIGLYSAVIIGLVTSLFGGRAGMISGATGAIAAVFVPLVEDYGVEYLFLAVILAGFFQIIFGLLDIGKLFRLISKPIMLGFVNGLAIIVLLAQLEQFRVPGTEHWLSGADLLLMIFFSAFTFFLIVFIPKYIKSIPSSLIAIFATTVIALCLEFLGVHLYNVKDMASAGFETAKDVNVSLNFTTLKIIFVPALSAAIVGLVESLLTLNLLDELTDTKGNTKRESIAQGLANIACGFAGGMGGCAFVGQSVINYNNGARKYLSSFIAASFLLFLIVLGKPIINIIPLSALVGVMLVVVYKTFDWDSIFLHRKASKFDTFVVILVATTTVITSNLALGVLFGIIISVLHFTWEKSKKLDFAIEDDTIIISGILFFGTKDKLKENLNLALDSFKDVKDIKLDFKNANISDYSGAQTLQDLLEKYKLKEINLKLENLNYDSEHKMLRLQKEN